MLELNDTAVSKLAQVFAPASAAIIGASTNPMKFGGRALKFCLERGYGGRLYPVNANNKVVQGVPAYPSIADLPEAPDIAVIAVPAPQVTDSLLAAGQKGCKVAIVYGAQFAEAGADGQARQDALLEIARAHDMRLIGPNCMGVISLASGFVASFTSAPEHHDGQGWPEVGTVSVASQSGAVGIQIFAQLRDRGLGLANWISTGNQADVDVADAIAYYAGDPATKTIAVYMEDASRGLKLLQALDLARRAKKPVVVLKVGTTTQGGVAAAGHTASMYVEDRVVDDLLAQYGVLRAGSINALIDLVAACNAGVPPKGNTVAAVSVSGGGAVMIADAAAKAGLCLPAFDAGALAELKSVNGFVNDRNPIDISAPSMSNMEITGGHLAWGVDQGAASMLGYISHVPLVPRTRTAIIPQLLQLADRRPDRFVAIAGNFHEADRKALVRSGVAVFDDPTAATVALGQLVATTRVFDRDRPPPGRPGPAVKPAREALAQAGLTLVEERPVADVEAALGMLQQHGAIVLKLSASGLHHRTELGGVLVDLPTAAAVRDAFDRLSARADVHQAEYPDIGIVAAPMVYGAEVLLGTRQDPHFGPLVLLGTGGTMCELFDDVTYRKAPVTEAEAEEMIDAVTAARQLSGWRGAPALDRGALARAIVALSSVAADLPSLEINPLIVGEDGVYGVDLLVAEP